MQIHKQSLTPAYRKGLHGIAAVLLGMLLSIFTETVLGAGGPRNLLLSPNRYGTFQVALHKAGIIQLGRPAAKVSVGSAEIADILLMPNDQLYVLGRTIGTTNVVLWDKAGHIFEAFDVDVTQDLENLKLKLHELLPGEPIKVSSAQGQLVMGGQVSSPAKMHAALRVAVGFLPECEPAKIAAAAAGAAAAGEAPDQPVQVRAGDASPWKATVQQIGCGPEKIVNMMEIAGAQQVMLEVKIAEIARDVVKRMDANTNLLQFGNPVFGANKGGAAFPDALIDTVTPGGREVVRNIPIVSGDTILGPDITDFTRAPVPAIDDSGLIFSYLSGSFLFETVLDASRQKGLGQVLAEPTLTTITGKKAEFLSGGEFPIPVPRSGSIGTTIEFKKFGVAVEFLPVVLDPGHISLQISASVSELSDATQVVVAFEEAANVFVVPGLTKRSASSTVELADGQTIGIAGLISDNTREFVDKLPGLGDVPVLGALFRSQEFRQGQTELVMFVTPRLARPISPQQVQLPTDSFVPPDDVEFYLLGRMEKERPEAEAPPAAGPLGAEPQTLPEGGKFGHDF